MKVLRYFKPVFLLCVFQLLVEFPCQGETHIGQSNGKSSAKNSIPRKNGSKNVLEKDLNRGRSSGDKREKYSSPKKQLDSAGSSENNHDRRGLNKDHIISHKEDVPLHMAAKADGKSTKPSVRTHQTEKSREIKNKNAVNGKSKRRSTHTKKSKLTNNSIPAKPDDFHPKGNPKRKKKKLFKKYALVQTFSPLQAQPLDYQPIATGGQEALAAGYSPVAEGDQAGDVKDQDPSQQQQQIGDGNSISQYDGAGYQQDSSQPAIANFVSNNGEDAGQSDGSQQPTSLEQAIQLQQEAYTQQPQEQGQGQDNTRPGTEGGDLGGQASQMIDGGQLQYQSEEPGQSQQQGTQEGAPEQDGTQTGYDQGGFQQGQTPELSQQQSQGFDDQLQQQQQQQQQQDQAQEYQQQQQQPSEESQESEAASSETQSFTTSTNSLGSLFGTEGQQTTAEQQGQGTVTYANEQPGQGGDKSGPPGVQYASSIEEALKEPSVSPQDSSSEEGDGQGSLGANDGTNVINIGGGSDSREGSNTGFMAAGTVSAPSGYQTAAIDDNGNNDQAVTGTEVNGYAPMNDQGPNNDATTIEENQQPQGTTSADNQNSFSFAGQQLQQAGIGEKMPSIDDDFNKIVDIANKNGPMAVKGCKGCPPHARCIDKVCIINDDQPLAHILNALSGPEPGEQSPPSECKECHYNAKCVQRECVCKAGYTGDGFDCRPDTCLPGCKQHGKCIKGFCVCDHHHYFNGYECAPYKITHRNCPLQCATRCHDGCPPNCCKHHRVLKIHYNDGNLQEINIPPNAPPKKNATTSHPTVVVLKPEGKVNEHVANFASEFQQRPADSESTNLEAVNLKNPAGGFAVSEMAARPLVEDEADCPAQCKSECRDSCPVRCCLGKCPLSCLENCQPSCPKICCHLPGAKHPIPMMDPQVQESFMKTMAEKFCPRACKAKCNPNCPPICCEVNSTHPATLESGDLQRLKGESKNSADFFRNAMSWFGMMNFLNMMYNMYGNLYGSKHFAKFPVKANDHKLKTVSLTKPKSVRTENHFNIKEVGVAESQNKANDLCPDYCNKSCLHICPSKCCLDKSEGKTFVKVGNPLKCQPSCALHCSKTCPPLCCSKNTTSSLADHHPTVQIKIAKPTPVSQPPRTQTPASSLPKPPAACTPICPAYCYPKCIESCCQRGEVTYKKLSQQPVAPDKAKQSYNNFFAKEPPVTSQDCPSDCRRDCGPSCPLRCCGRTVTLPTPTRLVASRPSINSPLCPGGCASECFPACTISCCRAGFKKEYSKVNVPAVSPTRRERQPGPNPPSFPRPPPAAVCHSGCSRSCYPNCDETCCRAYSERVSGLSDFKSAVSSHFTIKVPCPSECRPFNCLYYCHHDCCLPRSDTAELKKRRYQDQRKYFRGIRKVKAPTKPMLDKSTGGGRISNRRTVIHKRPTH